MEDEQQKSKWSRVGVPILIVLIVIAVVGIAWAAVRYVNNQNMGEDDLSSRSSQCDNVDTSDWLTYDNAYTVKYPNDWVYEELQGGAGGTQWNVKFGPDKENFLVYVGGSASDVDGLKEDLESGNMVQVTSKYKVLDQTLVNVYSPNDTRLTLQGPESYKSYLFYLVYGNIPPILMGPSDASSDQFSNCEPEVFLKIVDSYQVAQFPGQDDGNVDENVTETTYTDEDSLFSFKLPHGWQMTDRYFYSTAEGITSDVPTVLFKPTGSIDATKNYLNINLRQNFCPDTGSKNTEPIYGDSSIFIDFYYLDGNEVCAEVNLNGVDKNGQSTTHHFLMMYDSSIEGKDIFKDMIRSYLAS